MYSGDGVSVPAQTLTLCIMVSSVRPIAVWISGLFFEYGGLGLGFSNPCKYMQMTATS